MDNLSPAEIVSDALRAAEKKCRLSIANLTIRGALAGGLLGYSTSLVFVALSQGVPAIVGAIIFPAGFVILVLLGLELATGNFGLLPAAWIDRRITGAELLRNWMFVYAGNLIGSVLYAYLFYLAITSLGTNNGGALGDQLRTIAQKKTIAYAASGAVGFGTAFIKGILCNWMVTIGTMLAFASRSTAGKILAMWLPIATFFAHGYEHSIVNMFAIPAGMLLGSPVSMSQWWFWNQLPVTLGNIISGALLTGIALWFIHARHESSPQLAESNVDAVVAVAKAG